MRCLSYIVCLVFITVFGTSCAQETKKEKEIAQALFLKEKESKSRWHEDFLSRAAHPTAKGDDLKNPYLSFSGNGKVISLLSRPGGTKALQMIRDKDNGKKGYATLEIYLHRPKPGAPLELIR